MDDTMNRKERVMGFIYVSLLFVLVTVVCCILIFYYNSDFNMFSKKDFAITKMERIKEFQNIQSNKAPVVDALCDRINNFNPFVKAVYEENEIKYTIDDLGQIHSQHAKDMRYKTFLHVSEFYSMWFDDRKDLWSRKENVVKFKKNIEECQMNLNRTRNNRN